MRLGYMNGKRYGRLVVTEGRQLDDRRRAKVECICDCGTRKFVWPGLLRDGQVVSCGCYGREQTRLRKTTHGRSKKPEYRAWIAMKKRCGDPKNKFYHRYGGRGIRVSPEWETSFEVFYAEVGPRPTPRHSLDRIDNDRGYEPGNCRWALQSQQMRNTQRTHRVSAFGKNMCLTDWAHEKNMRYNTLASRLRRGWPIEVALSTGNLGNGGRRTQKAPA